MGGLESIALDRELMADDRENAFLWYTFTFGGGC